MMCQRREGKVVVKRLGMPSYHQKGTPMAREVVVYIHGVTPKGQYSHQWQYAALHEALRKRIGEGFPDDFCGVEWGWATPDTPARSHQLLDAAETRQAAVIGDVMARL